MQLELDNPWLYEEYLSKDLTTFMEKLLEAKLPVRALAFRSLSTASLHRKFLLPPAFSKWKDQLFQLLEKARKEELAGNFDILLYPMNLC